MVYTNETLEKEDMPAESRRREGRDERGERRGIEKEYNQDNQEKKDKKMGENKSGYIRGKRTKRQVLLKKKKENK